MDFKKFQDKIEQWGKLPAREREAIMIQATEKLDPKYREIVMEYFKRLSQQETNK